MLTLDNSSLPTSQVLSELGLRFREYRLRMNLTRKEVSEKSSVGMTTLYMLESGRMTDISFRTLLQLLRVLGMAANWEQLIPLLPETPYMYDSKGLKKRQRARSESTKIK